MYNVPGKDQLMEENGYPRGEVIGSFADYKSAQQAVIKLIDAGLPPVGLSIVGANILLVEQLVAPFSWWRIVRNSLLTGLYLGILVTLLASFFGEQSTELIVGRVVVVAAAFMLWTVVMAMVSHNKKFLSKKRRITTRFDVICHNNFAAAARQVLGNSPVQRPLQPEAAAAGPHNVSGPHNPAGSAAPGSAAPLGQDGDSEQKTRPQPAQHNPARFPDLPDGTPRYGVRTTGAQRPAPDIAGSRDAAQLPQSEAPQSETPQPESEQPEAPVSQQVEPEETERKQPQPPADGER